MSFIITRVEKAIADGISKSSFWFYTGSSWSNQQADARLLRHDSAVSLMTTLSVTAPLFSYRMVELGNSAPLTA